MDQIADPDRSAPAAAGHGVGVRIAGLVKRFGAFTALDHVSLDVAPGELVCCLGPSGCGKTTLLRAIAGLDRQDEGTIEMGGRDVSDVAPAMRDFGIVFQSYALFPNLTVDDNVGYGLVSRGLDRPEIARRVSELLALVGMPEQGSKYPSQLSGGQQQRVALARALATRPSLLLLDEPLSALDARVRLKLRDEIKALQQRLGVTTLMVTHDQGEALSMADRIVVMRAGRIEQVGTPQQVYAAPVSPFVADFIGTTSFIEATATGGARVDAGGLPLAVRAAPSGATRVRLGIRPESVEVGDEIRGSDNRFEAVVEALAYLGSHVRLTLAPVQAARLRLVADCGAAGVVRQKIMAGARIEVRLPPTALMVFDGASP